MRIKQLSVNDQTPTNEPQKISDEQLHNEFNFYQAEHLLMKLHENELISQKEFNQIRKLNRQKSTPLLGSLTCYKP